MSFLQPSLLPLLYQQHVQHSAELAQTHQKLGKVYKKLAKAERVLAQREERELSRSEKKKWQYTRALAKTTIANLEMEQVSLEQKLRQCNDAIVAHEYRAYNVQVMPWTTQMPPSPHMFTPYSPVAHPSWPTNTSQPSSGGQADETRPQDRDLSMLHERRLSSPYGSSADSGYNEPLVHGLSSTIDDIAATDHVFVHEHWQPKANTMILAGPSTPENDELIMTPSSEKEDGIATLQTLVSPAALLRGSECTSHHKRCFSVDVAQLHLKAPSSQGRTRGSSVGPAVTRELRAAEER